MCQLIETNVPIESTYLYPFAADSMAHKYYMYKLICNLEREYRDCIKSRRDKIRITRHVMMHQVLYIVQLSNEEGDMHII